jgi:hypothetical protein
MGRKPASIFGMRHICLRQTVTVSYLFKLNLLIQKQKCFFYSDQTIEYRPINILPQQKQNDKDKQLPLLQQEKVNGPEEEFVAILNLCGTFFFHHQHLKAFVLKYRKTHRRGNTCKLTSC